MIFFTTNHTNQEVFGRFLAEAQESVGKLKKLSQRRGNAGDAEFYVRFLFFFQEILLIIQRLLMNNVRYQISALRSQRLCVSARVILQNHVSFQYKFLKCVYMERH